MRLSERLDAEAASWESWNRDFPEDQSPLTPVLLREAAALAKRYEDAPVADLTWNWFSPVLVDASIRIEDPEQIRAFGVVESKSRVRIVLDKEG